MWLSPTESLHRLNGEQLGLVDYGGEDIPATCYHLSAADGLLWSIGAHDVMEFDGKRWTKIV